MDRGIKIIVEEIVKDVVKEEVKKQLSVSAKTEITKEDIKSEVRKQLRKIDKEEAKKELKNTAISISEEVEYKVDEGEKNAVDALFYSLEMNLEAVIGKTTQKREIDNFIKNRRAEIVSNNIKRIRAEKNISQRELAKELGLKYATYKSMEQGLRCTLSLVFLVSKRLGVAPSTLLSSNLENE